MLWHTYGWFVFTSEHWIVGEKVGIKVATEEFINRWEGCDSFLV